MNTLDANRWGRYLLGMLVIFACLDYSSLAHALQNDAVTSPGDDIMQAEEVVEQPWDYSPYRVLVWIASDNSTVGAKELDKPLREFLDRSFSAVWRVTVETAPASVAAVAQRSLESLTYDSISAADSVIAVKRNHPDAARLRTTADVKTYVNQVLSTASRVGAIKQQVAPGREEAMNGLVEQIAVIEGDALQLKQKWADESTEAMLVSRGMAMTLSDPEAKIISPPITGSVADSARQYDKIFFVDLSASARPMSVRVIELDTLMQVFGPVTQDVAVNRELLVSAMGSSIIRAFAPVVRIDDAGQKNATGLVRAGGLILDPSSPARIEPGDVLVPMVRKDDRNGKPITIGPIPWAYLLVVENEMTSFSARSIPDIQVGDAIMSMNESSIYTSFELEKKLRGSTASEITVGVQRAEKPIEVKLSQAKFSSLAPVYFGFTAMDKGIGDKRQLLVNSVLQDSPVDGKLRVGDAILSVGKSTGLDVEAFRRLVVSSAPDEAVEITVKRGEATETLTVVPSEMSDKERRHSVAVEMDFHAGRAGGLQGRNNKRTFRMALKARPHYDDTMIRMHVRGAVNEPLIGYEIYEKALQSKDMTFIGRTDWNGRLWLEKTEEPLRLLYVKNGGAILARLPIVPGETPVEIADMTGDDMRLQAEAYIRGVQNAIVDLIAIRELLAARVRLRLTKGEIQEAEKLLEMLRGEPTNEKIADDMGKKQTAYLKILGNGNANQRKMIDQMFTTTRELLSKHINPKLIRDLEADFIAATRNGGKLPEPPSENAGTTVARPESAPEPTPAATPAPEVSAAAVPVQ